MEQTSSRQQNRGTQNSAYWNRPDSKTGGRRTLRIADRSNTVYMSSAVVEEIRTLWGPNRSSNVGGLLGPYVMLCCAMLRYATLCYAMLPYCDRICSQILGTFWAPMLGYAMLCHAMLCYAIGTQEALECYDLLGPK